MPPAYRQLKNGSWAPADAVKAEAFFPSAWLATLGLDPDFTDLVRIRGDSMSPEIEDGDWVFVDRRVHHLTADDIYLLWDGFGVVAACTFGSGASPGGRRPR
jgi:phage repressor protein C with HTH and peptisase S24 domain